MKNMLDEFKEFALKGNLIDLAVAFILGLAFSAVVTALVNGMFLQVIAAIVGQPSFDQLSINLGDTPIFYGTFLTALINFLLVAFVLFLVIKGGQPHAEALPRAACSGHQELSLLLHSDSGGRDPL